MAADKGGDAGAQSVGPDEETKRKFREALERKNAEAGGGTEHRDGVAKQPKAHGPVEGRREFRRKSG